MLDPKAYVLFQKNFRCLIFSNDVGMARLFLDSSSNLPSFSYPNVLDFFPHYFDVLVESFTLFITNVSTSFRKTVQMTMNKMIFFILILAPSSILFNLLLAHNFLFKLLNVKLVWKHICWCCEKGRILSKLRAAYK